MAGNPRNLPLIKLIGRQGDVTESDFEGRLSLVLFGFSHCPDICPTGLANLASLGARSNPDKLNPKLQLVFISVDPERDDVTRLADLIRD